jgi:cation diffusion facilitator CzcD-associated flavoprotein CzcO
MSTPTADITVDIAIVGAGFAGLGAAARLAAEGRNDFLVLEKAESVGGTWRDNTYPGCTCDVQSALYSFSFAPNPGWTHRFARQPEIRAYLEDIADRCGLRSRIRFGARVTSATWEGKGWALRIADGSTVSARVVVWAPGGLREMAVPDIEGLATFRGTTFHSADWNHDHDLRGRRVAVIGTGASAIQFVPAIQPDVEHLTLFQRTAPWVVPKSDGEVSPLLRRLYRAVPLLQKLKRAAVYARGEAVLAFFLRTSRAKVPEKVGRTYIDRVFADRPDLRGKVTPDFAFGCKRVLLSDDYYPALKQPNVAVVTEKIVRVTEAGVVTADGVEHEVDTIILGTGFKVAASFLDSMEVTGRDGVSLGEAWRDGIEGFLGTTVAGFPNLFLMTGPNTAIGHTSLVVMIEAQLNYVLDALRLLDRTGATALDTRRDRQVAYNIATQRKFAGTVWTAGGCKSWYLDEDGRNRTIWPNFTFVFRRRTRRVRPADHELLV